MSKMGRWVRFILRIHGSLRSLLKLSRSRLLTSMQIDEKFHLIDILLAGGILCLVESPPSGVVLG